MMGIQRMNRTTLRRWLTRIFAFTAILTYGLVLVSSPKQLRKLLDAAFDTAPVFDSINDGFRRTPYHHHIRTFKRANDTDESSVITSTRTENENNNSTSLSTSTDTVIRISFELHDPQTAPLQNVFNLYVTCPLGKVMEGKKRARHATGEFRSGELPPSLYRVRDEGTLDGYIRSGRVLDFTVTISTDLKLLLVGDSVMVQLAQAFDEIVGGHALQSRKVVWDAWTGHDGGTVVAPTRGGGASALWRMTGLLSQSRKGKAPANSNGGGWSDKEINAFSSYTYPVQGQHNNLNLTQQQKRLGKFDVVIFRVMHGWMKIHEITHKRLVEAVELSHELLGATTVVLMTIPFTNNVKDAQEMMRVNEVNDDIRDIAKSWHLRNSSGVQHVLVMEYGTYYNHIIWSNARHLGYENVSNPLRATQHTFTMEGPAFLQERLDSPGWAPSIPMVCADMHSLGAERKMCNRNYLFSDGMHTCPEKVASRYAAGLACLIGCVYNRRQQEESISKNHDDDVNNAKRDTAELEERKIRECEQECNEQFMTVIPVEESWIDTNTTLAAFAG